MMELIMRLTDPPFSWLLELGARQLQKLRLDLDGFRAVLYCSRECLAAWQNEQDSGKYWDHAK